MRQSLSLSVLLVVVLIVSNVAAKPTPSIRPSYSNRIIFIRHAEKGFAHAQQAGRPPTRSWWPHLPPWGPPGDGHGEPGRKFPEGLSDKGLERAQYIRTLFANESEYDIDLIFAAPRDPDVKDTERTYATVAPLAQDLGLDIDIECANAEASCVVGKIEDFAKHSYADILISWKHRDLNVIATALGAPNARRTYPDNRNDVIWIMQDGEIVEKRSMHCPGLDDARVDEGDPDLVVEQPFQSFSSWIMSWGGLRSVWHAQQQVVTTASS